MGTPFQTVLLADDNADDACLIAHALQGIANLHCVPSGPAAVEVLNRALTHCLALPDALLLDLHLPPASGLMVLSWARNQPRLRVLPIYVFTSSISPDQLQAARHLGATDVWDKDQLLNPPSRLRESLIQTLPNFSLLPGAYPSESRFPDGFTRL